MRKITSITILFFVTIALSAQVPYFGATVGEGKVFGYSSLKFRPGINAQETYTTLQFGIKDYFSVGTDIYANSGTVDHGLYARAGWTWNKWFSAGIQAAYVSNLRENYKFSNVNTGVFFNGNVIENGLLFWTSNTWLTFNQDGNHSYNQWLYLGSNVKIDDSNSIVPMVGLIHSWKFDTDVDLAAGFYYMYKKYSFYLWGNDFFTEHPRLTVAVDFTF